MAEKVDGVLDPPSPDKRATVEGYPHRLRQLLSLGLGHPVFADKPRRAFQKDLIEAVLDHALTKALQRALDRKSVV